MKRTCLLLAALMIGQGAHAALTLANFNIDPSTGAISGTITGTVSEGYLGTTANNTIYIGQHGVDWVTDGTFAGSNSTGIVSVGAGSDLNNQGSYSVGGAVSWFDNQDFFSLTLDATAVLGDQIDFTFQNSIISSVYSTVNTSLLTDPVVRVGVGSVDPAVVPEPSTYATILGVLCLGFIVIRRRQRRQ